MALSGGLYSAEGTVRAALAAEMGRAPAALSPGTVVLLLGGSLVLSVLGAVTTIFMASRSREREFALIQAAGGTRRTILAAAAWEAVIYVGTAAILGVGAVAVTALGGAWALRAQPTHLLPSLGLSAIGLTVCCGLILTLLATVVPTAATLRHEVPRVLAAE
ncbi:FtsX-like permease family protein [Streptosporangium sp. G11]|uniref:FtsX-like permease family protein n=1 Tax=Streptosporangium sp. G11 TaxID=3436926 RepID=UPI003EC04930